MNELAMMRELELSSTKELISQMEARLAVLKQRFAILESTQPPTRFKFFVNGYELGTNELVVTGKLVREILSAWEESQPRNPEDWPESEAQASWSLWLDHTGNTPAEQIYDTTEMPLDGCEPPRFFTMPPTTN